MECKNCGTLNNDDAQYCSKCGSALNADDTASKEKGINIIGLIASLVLLASAFLPLFSVNVFGTKINSTLIDGSDWIIVVIIGVLGIWCSSKDSGTALIICGILGFAYFLYVIYSINNRLSSSVSELVATIARGMIEKGLGYFALLFGSIGLVVAGIISKKKSA